MRLFDLFIELIKVVLAKSSPDANFQFAIIVIMGIIVISSKENELNVNCSSWPSPAILDHTTVIQYWIPFCLIIVFLYYSIEPMMLLSRDISRLNSTRENIIK